jgi:hypothetical protein
MKLRKAPLIDLGFGIGATFEALGEYVGYAVTGSPDLLEMAKDSGIAALAYFAKTAVSYAAAGAEESKERKADDPAVNGTGMGINLIAGVANEIVKNSIGYRSKSIAYNALTAECLASGFANAVELHIKK